MHQHVQDYFDTLGALPLRSEVTDARGREIGLADCFAKLQPLLGGYRRAGKVMFVGNGGSATIASHMAIDFSKNGNIPALCFNDGAALTCLGNDLGYDQVFAHQVASLGQLGDTLIAISSSGRSANIVNAVRAARSVGAYVVTLSGFDPDNPLRRLGDYNLYVPAGEYGFVEIVHLSLCHALLDLAMGWSREKGLWSAGEGNQAVAKAGVA
ncbi:MAG TPA: SIS domain-containing protein [Alphaproteobacteria bacterium]|jgi:D-sedoheptulose 7-phosphate isomerase|nr:SIS domain-containing protein [Alphaproteobacteria bacterium]